jgi:hypothetical protein
VSGQPDRMAQIAQHLGEALRLLGEHEREVKARFHGHGDVDVAMIRESFLAGSFRHAASVAWNLSADHTWKIEDLVTGRGLTVDQARLEAGC